MEGQERYPQSWRNSPENLQRLPLITPSGQRIALGDVSNIRIENGPAGIKSEDARINGWTFIDIEDIDVGTYVEQARDILHQQLVLPAGYSVRWAGQYEYINRAKEKLTYVIPLTLGIILLLLYLNFRSLTEVLMIMGTLPMALIGGLWLMYWQGFHFSVAVGVGFIALAGVAVEIGVIMLVYLNQSVKDIRGRLDAQGREMNLQDFVEAIIEGAGKRVRPVVMTVATIIVGLLPVMHGKGTGSEVMSRIATPMVGGDAQCYRINFDCPSCSVPLIQKTRLFRSRVIGKKP